MEYWRGTRQSSRLNGRGGGQSSGQIVSVRRNFCEVPLADPEAGNIHASLDRGIQPLDLRPSDTVFPTSLGFHEHVGFALPCQYVPASLAFPVIGLDDRLQESFRVLWKNALFGD